MEFIPLISALVRVLGWLLFAVVLFYVLLLGFGAIPSVQRQ